MFLKHEWMMEFGTGGRFPSKMACVVNFLSHVWQVLCGAAASPLYNMSGPKRHSLPAIDNLQSSFYNLESNKCAR
jgi:hypothetical protein